jgi:hypothetical protein
MEQIGKPRDVKKKARRPAAVVSVDVVHIPSALGSRIADEVAECVRDGSRQRWPRRLCFI